MNPCFAVLPYKFIPNTAQLEWPFLLWSCVKCAATTGIHPASHSRTQATRHTSYQTVKLEKRQMQIKAAQHTPKMLENQTVCIFN